MVPKAARGQEDRILLLQWFYICGTFDTPTMPLNFAKEPINSSIKQGILISYWVDYGVSKALPIVTRSGGEIPIDLQLLPAGLLGLRDLGEGEL